MNSQWSPEEDALLHKLFHCATKQELITAFPGRSRTSQNSRAYLLGLNRPYIATKRLTPEEAERRRRLCSKVCSDRRRMDPRFSMFHNAKHRASVTKLSFTISIDDIVIPACCPLLGIPLTKQKKRTAPNSPSLDRKDPAKGYVPDNIWVISHKANRIKSNASLEELEKVASNLRQLMSSP